MPEHLAEVLVLNVVSLIITTLETKPYREGFDLSYLSTSKTSSTQREMRPLNGTKYVQVIKYGQHKAEVFHS